MIPGMILLAGMSQIMAQGSSLLCMVPVGMVGAYTHWQLGNIKKKILPGLLPGIFLGAWAGGSVAQYLPESALRILFAIVIFWTGIRYIGAKAQATTPSREPDGQSM